MKYLYGVVTALVTPTDNKNNINYEVLGKLVNHLVANGVDGLYPLGSTGEMLYLSLEERKKIAEYVVESAGRRVPVFIHVAANNTKDTITLAQHARDSGADGIAAVTPYYYHLSDIELFDYYSSISKCVPEEFPVYLYNLPQNTCNDISFPLCEKLAKECPNIVGIKYSFPDMVRTQQYVTINDGVFSVLHGTDTLLDLVLTAGCKGVVSGLSNAFPREFANAYEAFERKDYDSLQDAMGTIQKIGNILLNGNGIANIKAATELMGFDVGNDISPMRSLSKNEKDELAYKLRKAGLIEQ